MILFFILLLLFIKYLDLEFQKEKNINRLNKIVSV
jgi:hypothetical protein